MMALPVLVSASTDWLSASEIARERLPGLPGSRENAARFISRVAALNPELVRKRVGQGGGLEVAIEALPPAARKELDRRAHSQVERQGELFDLAAEHERNKRQIAVRTIGHLTARQRQVMEARASVLLAIEGRALVEGCGKDRAVRAFVADAAAGDLDPAQIAAVVTANDRGVGSELSRPTVYRWFKAREELGIAGLAPAVTRQKSDLPVWFDDFLRHYAKPSKPSIAEALRDFNKTLPAGAARPTEAAVRRCLKKMPQLERLKGREGKLALRARLAYTARDTSDLLPSSVYVADGKTYPAEIAHPIHGQPFRPEISTIEDVATRRIMGWSAALDENTFGVVDALRRACAVAIPAIFYTDRGPGYKNKAMNAPLTGFLSRAGITPMHALPYNSQAKGNVERLNQLYNASAKKLPTYVGKDMDKEAKLLVFKSTRRDIAVTGTSRLLPGWDAFLDHVERDIQTYNDRPHSELPKIRDPQLGRVRHMTPNELWAAKLDGFEPIIPDQAELDDMFRPYQVRRTRRALVDWLGNSYFAPALEPFDGQDVMVGYDIHDASRVWVREIDEVDDERVPGRLLAIAEFEGHKTRYVPLSAEQAAMERRAKGRLDRLQKKMDVVGQELHPAKLLTLTPAAPAIEIAPISVMTPALAPVPAANDQVQRPVAAAPVQSGKRPVFHDDVAFASWLAAHPQEATASDLALLRELLTTHSTSELLRMSGVDLEALRSIARSSRPSGA